jgi:galactokinase
VGAFVTAISTGDWAAAGALMTASHASLRDDYEVSCPELDLVADTAIENGALGARMTGGGFGGSAIALVPLGRLRDVERAIHRAFTVDGRGPPPPDPVEAARGGARRPDRVPGRGVAWC